MIRIFIGCVLYNGYISECFLGARRLYKCWFCNNEWLIIEMYHKNNIQINKRFQILFIIRCQLVKEKTENFISLTYTTFQRKFIIRFSLCFILQKL